MDNSLLFSELPYAAAVVEDCFGKHEICWSCFLPTKVNRCALCKTAAYCSKKCQKGDWKRQHQFECPVFLKVEGSDRNILGTNVHLRLVARILARKSIDGGKQSPEGKVYKYEKKRGLLVGTHGSLVGKCIWVTLTLTQLTLTQISH